MTTYTSRNIILYKSGRFFQRLTLVKQLHKECAIADGVKSRSANDESVGYSRAWTLKVTSHQQPGCSQLKGKERPIYEDGRNIEVASLMSSVHACGSEPTEDRVAL